MITCSCYESILHSHKTTQSNKPLKGNQKNDIIVASYWVYSWFILSSEYVLYSLCKSYK